MSQLVSKAWQLDWGRDVSKMIMKPFRSPSFSIPRYLVQRYYNSRCTVMPAGPLVKRYGVLLYRAEKLSPLGQYPMKADVTVEWKPEARELLTKRDKLIGSHRQLIDQYHSQAAFAGSWLLLNEVQRKINRTKLYLQDLKNLIEKCSPKWDELWLSILSEYDKRMKLDPILFDKYAKEHASSSIIPGTMFYRPKKWSELQREDIEDLFECAKTWVEDLTTNFDTWRHMIIKTEKTGKAIRARSAEIPEMSDTYTLEFDRSRQAMFEPRDSSWNAFITDQDKLDIYDRLIKGSEDILGCKILFPPRERGRYWKAISDYLSEGNDLINADGSNWEAWSATIGDYYAQAVDDGVPQFMSGAATTSIFGSFAMLKLTEVNIPQHSRLTAIGVLGDDEVLIAPKERLAGIKSLPNIWEIDEIATKYRVILGLMILPELKGTFPGLYRITVDRGDKRIVSEIGKRSDDIEGDIPQDSFEVYKEVMGDGTIHGKPMIDLIAHEEKRDFWEVWRTDRYEMLGQLGEEGFELVESEEDVSDFL